MYSLAQASSHLEDYSVPRNNKKAGHAFLISILLHVVMLYFLYYFFVEEKPNILKDVAQRVVVNMSIMSRVEPAPETIPKPQAEPPSEPIAEPIAEVKPEKSITVPDEVITSIGDTEIKIEAEPIAEILEPEPEILIEPEVLIEPDVEPEKFVPVETLKPEPVIEDIIKAPEITTSDFTLPDEVVVLEEASVEETIDDGSSRYKALILQRIKEQFFYPESALAREIEGTVILSIEVHANGKIKKIKVFSSAGNKLLDRGALRILKSVGKLPPFPENMSSKVLELDVPIEFKLI